MTDVYGTFSGMAFENENLEEKLHHKYHMT
jgi:hypothetical protein